MGKQLLQVGDILYQHHQYGKGVNKFTVIRVTPTQAILNDGNKTKRQILNSTHETNCSYVCAIGFYRHYYCETTSLKERYEWWSLNRKVAGLISKLNCDNLDAYQLAKLHELLLTFEPVKNEPQKHENNPI